ncbi:MAG: hypothetical protein KGN98_05330 [Alphaproteobacteria bacterium]|jgi:hypothetical protein|nr:hypothetical protein [Alphaproteobacteria bacterium]
MGRVVGSYALLAMHGWFLAKLALPSASGALEMLVGMAALTGLIASITFFVGSYGVIANAPDSMLDEREQSVRYRAYFSAFQYIVVMTIAGGMIPELLAKLFNFELSVAVMKNFMLLMFATALILPGFLIAWSDRDIVD